MPRFVADEARKNSAPLDDMPQHQPTNDPHSWNRTHQPRPDAVLDQIPLATTWFWTISRVGLTSLSVLVDAGLRPRTNEQRVSMLSPLPLTVGPIRLPKMTCEAKPNKSKRRPWRKQTGDLGRPRRPKAAREPLRCRACAPDPRSSRLPVLLQHPNDLLFREPPSLHLSVLVSRPDSKSPWREISVAGQQLPFAQLMRQRPTNAGHGRSLTAQSVNPRQDAVNLKILGLALEAVKNIA